MRSRALIVVPVLALALGPALAGCRSGGDGARVDTGDLTRQQYDAAVNTARHEIENQDAKVTSATAVLKHNAGKNAPTNTGHRCTGDQVLRIRLIGTFPHTVTTGTPGGGSTTVTEMDIKADPGTGEACLIGVGTAKHPRPEKGATVLQLDD
jgi:hypothetical protein